jgi:hypothetical protein
VGLNKLLAKTKNFSFYRLHHRYHYHHLLTYSLHTTVFFSTKHKKSLQIIPYVESPHYTSRNVVFHLRVFSLLLIVALRETKVDEDVDGLKLVFIFNYYYYNKCTWFFTFPPFSFFKSSSSPSASFCHLLLGFYRPLSIGFIRVLRCLLSPIFAFIGSPDDVR